MRFRISTILFSIAIAAICMGWHLESSSRHDISGVWYYPNGDMTVLGYRETLTITKDGGFTKVETHRKFKESFSGIWSENEDGTYCFYVTEKTLGSNDKTISVDKTYTCRCALDSQDNLVIRPIGYDFGCEQPIRNEDDCFLEWHCYTRKTYEQRRQLDELERVFGSADAG